LMDINLPGMSGIDCVEKLKAIDPSLPIVMLTVFEDTDKIFKALVAGACGYLVKRTPPEEILAAIKEVHRGGAPMSTQIARKVVQSFHKMGLSPKDTENLTDRETQILEGLAKGYLCKEIADNLGISLETVRTHMKKIYEKLHVRSRTQAVLKYLGK
jgi:DNA-binding NarL/FixJ family response regulator